MKWGNSCMIVLFMKGLFKNLFEGFFEGEAFLWENCNFTLYDYLNLPKNSQHMLNSKIEHLIH